MSMQENPYQAPASVEATLVDDAAESAEDLRRAASIFRALVALYGVLIIATIAVSFAAEGFLPEELQLYLEYEAEAPLTPAMIVGLLIAAPSLFCVLLGWVGMFFFWRPSRWLFLAAQVLLFGVICLFGPYVTHGVEDALDFTSQLLAGAILGAAFLSPLRKLFATGARGFKVGHSRSE